MRIIHGTHRISRLIRWRPGRQDDLTEQVRQLRADVERCTIAVGESETRLRSEMASRLDDAWAAAQLRHEHVVNLIARLNADEHDMSQLMHRTALDLTRQLSHDVAVTRQQLSDVLLLLGHPMATQQALRAAVYADASL